MFLKQYNYKPRTGSTGSQDAQKPAEQPASTTTTTTNNQGSISAAAAGRRRSSAGEQFAGLQGYKRNSIDSKNPGVSDQHQQGGVLGQMWTNFTKGTK